MNDRLQQLIRLIKRTGDKLVVFDSITPDDSYVIMPSGDYEKLAAQARGVKGLTEDELIDKINQDITVWKSERSGTPGFSDFPKENHKPTPKSVWKIPESRKREAAEIIEEPPYPDEPAFE